MSSGTLSSPLFILISPPSPLAVYSAFVYQMFPPQAFWVSLQQLEAGGSLNLGQCGSTI